MAESVPDSPSSPSTKLLPERNKEVKKIKEVEVRIKYSDGESNTPKGCIVRFNPMFRDTVYDIEEFIYLIHQRIRDHFYTIRQLPEDYDFENPLVDQEIEVIEDETPETSDDDEWFETTKISRDKWMEENPQ